MELLLVVAAVRKQFELASGTSFRQEIFHLSRLMEWCDILGEKLAKLLPKSLLTNEFFVSFALGYPQIALPVHLIEDGKGLYECG